MRTAPLLPLLVALALGAQGAASAAHAGGLPRCDAKHKRPANPYGSVLSAGLSPALAVDPASGLNGGVAPAAPSKDAAKPQQVSRAALRASFAPCGKARA